MSERLLFNINSAISQLGQTKDYKIGICCFSTKYAALMSKTGWLGIRIMCLSGATCLPVDCCFSSTSTLKSISACWSSTKQTSSSFHKKCNMFLCKNTDRDQAIILCKDTNRDQAIILCKDTDSGQAIFCVRIYTDSDQAIIFFCDHDLYSYTK
jgi:hypothetical protein